MTKTWLWCSTRSRTAEAIVSTPKGCPHCVMVRLVVMRVLRRSSCRLTNWKNGLAVLLEWQVAELVDDEQLGLGVEGDLQGLAPPRPDHRLALCSRGRMHDQGLRELRRELAAFGGLGRYYPDGLRARARAARWARRRLDAGAGLTAVATGLGLRCDTLRQWTAEPKRAMTTALVPVEAVEAARRSGRWRASRTCRGRGT